MAHETGNLGFSPLHARRWHFGQLDAIARYRDWARRRKIYNSTFRDLARCSDRELADISISRHDIPRIAAEAARTAAREQGQ